MLKTTRTAAPLTASSLRLLPPNIARALVLADIRSLVYTFMLTNSVLNRWDERRAVSYNKGEDACFYAIAMTNIPSPTFSSKNSRPWVVTVIDFRREFLASYDFQSTRDNLYGYGLESFWVAGWLWFGFPTVIHVRRCNRPTQATAVLYNSTSSRRHLQQRLV